jgi:hypothetical protein
MPAAFDPSAFLDRLLAVLVALFGASARVVGRIAGLRGRVRAGFARLVAERARRGQPLAWWGEDADRVDARAARLEWIARDPVKAMRHLSRRARGLFRVRLCAEFAPLAFAPPVLAAPPLAGGLAAVAAPEPET